MGKIGLLAHRKVWYKAGHVALDRCYKMALTLHNWAKLWLNSKFLVKIVYQIFTSSGCSVMIERIEWLGHASFRITGDPVIYLDPWRIMRGSIPADIILITHDHYDHCSPPDVDKLRKEETIVVSNASSATYLGNAVILRPWQTMNVGRVSIKAVPAYNSHHPLEFGGLGFVISMDYYDIYYAGDTDLIPEMDRISPDIAILPIGGRQTMNTAMAIEAVRKMRPRWVIPSHWGTASEGGTLVDAKTFSTGVEGLTQVVMPDMVR
jgi:L-ascorbate metabolism protein UlaG (beta-lactamase superfamily)